MYPRLTIDLSLLFWKDFVLEKSPECQYDYLAVYDGSDDSAQRLAKLCAFQFPDDIYSTGNDVLIQFVSDAGLTSVGVNMTYEFQIDTGIKRDFQNFMAFTAVYLKNL